MHLKTGGPGARVEMCAAAHDYYWGTRFCFTFNESHTSITYFDSTDLAHHLIQDAPVGITYDWRDTYQPIWLSWCNSSLAIGRRLPGEEHEWPQLTTSLNTTVSESINYVLAISDNHDSWVSFFSPNSQVADSWLFTDAGYSDDVVMDLAPDQYALLYIGTTDSVTVKYDCMAEKNCFVYLRGSSHQVLFIGVGHNNQEIIEIYVGDVTAQTTPLATGPVLSDTEFNTFNVTYNLTTVSVYRNNDVTPIYQQPALLQLPDVDRIGIGGPEVRKFVRVARYDRAWSTRELVYGRGFRNAAEYPN